MKKEGMSKKRKERNWLKIFGCICAAGLCLLLPSKEAAAQETLTVEVFGSYDRSAAQDIFQQVNAFRTGDNVWYWDESDSEKIVPEGLEALTYDYDLQKAAEQRAAEIALSYAHTRPDGTDCFSAYENAENYMAMGENIAAGQTSAGEVFGDWKEEDKNYDGQGHRRNMLSADFNAIGIASFNVDNVTFWVQEFGYTDTPNTEAPEDSGAGAYMPVRIDVSEGSGTVLSDIRPKTSKIGVAVNGGVRIPVVNAKLKMKNTHQADAVSVTVSNVSWTVADESVASLSEYNGAAMINGQGVTGNTTLSADILGTTVSIRVYVTEDGTFDTSEGSIPIDEEHFPDEAFRTYIEEYIDLDDVGYLDEVDIASCDEMIIGTEYGVIHDLSGIEYFTNLSVLRLDGHELAVLDLFGNQTVTRLSVDGGSVKELDFSGNPNLTDLALANLPSLESLRLPDTKEMASLSFDNVSGITALDVSGYEKLSAFSSYHMQFDSLNFDGCSRLKTLDVFGSSLKELSVSGCTAMETLDCSQNELESLDVSGMTELKSLDCSRNQIQTLILGGNVRLENLMCGENQISALDVSAYPQLINLECQENQITSLTLGNENLMRLNCTYNPLGVLNLDGCPNLERLLCSDCKLKALDVTETPKLVKLNCGSGYASAEDSDNAFPTIEGLAQLTQLQMLYAPSASLTSADVSKCTELRYLELAGNAGIEEIDVTACPELMELSLGGTGIAKIDLSKNPELLRLSLMGAKLGEVDLSGNPKLKYADVSENHLKALDVSANTALVHLDCDDNEISELNLKGCANLHGLEVSRNKLFRLDTSSNPSIGYISATELQYEDAAGNQLQYNFTTYLHSFDFLEVYGEEYVDKITEADYWDKDYNYEAGITAADSGESEKEDSFRADSEENKEEGISLAASENDEEKSVGTLSQEAAECYINEYIDVPDEAVSGRTIDLSKVVDTSGFDTKKIGKQHNLSVSGTKITVTGNTQRLYFDYNDPVFVSDSGLQFPLRYRFVLSSEAEKTVTDALVLPSYKAKVGSYSGAYDGKSHTISISGVKAGSVITYRTAANQSYSKTKPSRKSVGKTTVYYRITNSDYETITGSAAITIVPKGTSLKKVSAAKKGFTAKWKKQGTETTGYQIRYSLKSNMSKAKVKTISKTKTTSKKITGLKKKKNYYVQIRTYKKTGGATYYSSWSGKKKVKTK